MTAVRCGLLLGALTLAGCVSNGETVSHGAPAHTSRHWLEDWDRLVQKTTAEARAAGVAALERLVKDGEHAAVHQLALRPASRLDAPATSAAEALIVVEGGGSLEVEGSWRPVQAGDLLVLPAGARGRARARPDRPLLALAVRSKAPPQQGAPPAKATTFAIDDEALYPSAALHGPERLWRQRAARIPGQLAVDAVIVKQGELPRHVHFAHDEVVFVLQGFGTLGHGEDGPPVETDSGERTLEISRGFVSSGVRAKSLIYLPTRAAHSFQDEANPTLALSFSAPEQAEDADTYVVPDSSQAQQGEAPRLEEERHPGVERAGPPPPTPARRVRLQPDDSGRQGR